MLLNHHQPQPVLSGSLLSNPGCVPICCSVFNSGFTPHQFTSEADILAAAKAGQITLIDTGEVYRDSVVGGSSHA
jgi:aryl-alcohol dehydrogenase-like predicted oxidoreductase